VNITCYLKRIKIKEGRILDKPFTMQYLKDGVIEVRPINHEFDQETYALFNTLSKRLSSAMALPYYHNCYGSKAIIELISLK